MTAGPFVLQPHLERLYREPRQLTFTAESPEEFRGWRRRLRGKVAELLGIAGRTLPEVISPTLLGVAERDGYREEKYALDAGEGVQVPLYVLVPHAEPPYKAVLVFHGHNPGVGYVLGRYPDEATARERLALDTNYAQALAWAGYLVCAVEQRGFGERVSEQYSQEFASSCRHLSFTYLMQGRTLLGERCWDGMLALSYLQSRDDVLPGAVGCTGNSGGGTTTLWLSVLDERIKVVVPSCYFCSFKHSILGVYHCECNYVPTALRYFEMGDLAAAMAPRPFRVIAGEYDPLFPVAAVREQFETVKRAYGLLGAPGCCSLALHPGAHQYHQGMAREWFGRWL